MSLPGADPAIHAPAPRFGARENWATAALVALFVAAGAAGFIVPNTQLANAIFLPDIGVMVAIGLISSWRRTLLIFAAAEIIEPLLLAGAHVSPLNIALVQFWYSIQGLGIVLLTKQFLGLNPEFTRVSALLKFSAGIVLPITVMVFSADGTTRLLLHTAPFWKPLLGSIPYTLGILIVVPIAVTATRANALDVVGRSRIELGLLFVALATVETAVALQDALSAQFLLFPCLIAICFRLGARATALAAGMVCMQAFLFALLGIGGMAANLGSTQLVLQLFMVAVVFTVLPVAGAIAEQARLRQSLIAREVVALEATERAERSAAAKADFLATMSHELRTPLNGILGFTELLREDTSLSVAAARKLSLVAESGQSVLMVVNDILDYSKIEAGKIEFDPRPFDCGYWASGTADLVRGLTAAKGLAFTIDIEDAAAGWFLGDDARLRQVLLNLLNNAIKFTKDICGDNRYDLGGGRGEIV